MEYCSRIPPQQQVGAIQGEASQPTVMVPVGVLKRDNSSKLVIVEINDGLSKF